MTLLAVALLKELVLSRKTNMQLSDAFAVVVAVTIDCESGPETWIAVQFRLENTYFVPVVVCNLRKMVKNYPSGFIDLRNYVTDA